MLLIRAGDGVWLTLVVILRDSWTPVRITWNVKIKKELSFAPLFKRLLNSIYYPSNGHKYNFNIIFEQFVFRTVTEKNFILISVIVLYWGIGSIRRHKYLTYHPEEDGLPFGDLEMLPMSKRALFKGVSTSSVCDPLLWSHIGIFSL